MNKKSIVEWLPVAFLAGLVIWFLGFYVMYPTTRGQTLAMWSFYAWNAENDFIHGRAIPFAFMAFVVAGWKEMVRAEKVPSRSGLFICLFGALLYVVSIRTLQPRLALIGLPFLILGSVHFLYGWKVTRVMLFPAFFWYFAIPLPGIQQATNFLQVWVTGACYSIGSLCGMDLVHTGNDIRSATGAWDVTIAAGCSGIKSLMALTMISAIYAYYTQKTLWKKIILFGCSLPLAVFGNFLRVFTIILLSEGGHKDLATGLYHDYAGMLIFFPATLSGLFLIDSKILNRRKMKIKIVSKK